MPAFTPINRYIPFLVTTILLIVSCCGTTWGQVAGSDADIFCGKKWYSEMTKSADGTIFPTDSSKANNYMHFLCDSNAFTLVEDSITLKGTWIFDEATMVITLHQNQLNNLPEKFSFHIIEYDDTHMVILGQQGAAQQETIYLYTK